MPGGSCLALRASGAGGSTASAPMLPLRCVPQTQFPLPAARVLTSAHASRALLVALEMACQLVFLSASFQSSSASLPSVLCAAEPCPVACVLMAVCGSMCTSVCCSVVRKLRRTLPRLWPPCRCGASSGCRYPSDRSCSGSCSSPSGGMSSFVCSSPRLQRVFVRPWLSSLRL